MNVAGDTVPRTRNGGFYPVILGYSRMNGTPTSTLKPLATSSLYKMFSMM